MHGEAIGNYRGDPSYHSSLAAGEYEALINQSGFELIEHITNDVRAAGRTVWLCRSYLPDRGKAPIMAAVDMAICRHISSSGSAA
jgi:hypothetical protein